MTEPHSSRTRRSLLAAVGSAALGGCGLRSDDDPEPADQDETEETPAEETPTPTPDEDRPDWEPPTGSPPLDVEIEVLVENLETPWDMAFAPTGDLFVTERAGRLSRFDAERVLDATDPLDADEAALERREWPGDSALGVAIHPSYPEPAYVYVYHNVDGENRVARLDAAAAEPRETVEPVVEGIEGDHTIGGRIDFGPDGDLWITAGTAEGDPARDPASLGGTILRVTPDGDPSAASPRIEGGDPRVFAYGLRNPQGLAWLPDGRPLCADHGPTGRDEVNLLRRATDYGWPEVRGGPDDREYGSYADHPEDGRPLVNTGPDETWAPGGCIFYDGGAIPEWRHRLLVATLRGRHLDVVTLTPPGADDPPLSEAARRYDADWLDDTFTATSHRVLEGDLGRIRHVAQAPDGSVLVVSSNRDGAPDEDDPIPRDRDDVLVRLRSA